MPLYRHHYPALLSGQAPFSGISHHTPLLRMPPKIFYSINYKLKKKTIKINNSILDQLGPFVFTRLGFG
jgi:hypothetical protein